MSVRESKLANGMRVITDTMTVLGIVGATGLLKGATPLTPVNNTLDSFGLLNDDVLDLVEAA